MVRSPRRRAIPFSPPQANYAPIATINTTPLIDMMLVILIMVIVAIPVANHKVPLDLPIRRTGDGAARRATCWPSPRTERSPGTGGRSLRRSSAHACRPCAPIRSGRCSSSMPQGRRVTSGSTRCSARSPAPE